LTATEVEDDEMIALFVGTNVVGEGRGALAVSTVLAEVSIYGMGAVRRTGRSSLRLEVSP
jgi:hypothetical protein